MKLQALAFVSVALAAAVARSGTDGNGEFGGDITVWPDNAGLFLFVDTQSRIEGGAVEKPIAELAADFNIDIRRIAGAPGEVDVRKSPAELKGYGAKGGIWIVDDPALPVSLAAIEDGWGVLNVAPILSDEPAAAVLALRVKKYINRLFADLHGIGDPVMMPACVMKPAVGMKGVDALVCSTFSPESTGKIISALASAGYKQRKFGTYYDACEEGWAPAPTNAVQKAIWDKVHQLPTKPIKIQPPDARRK